MKNVLVVFCDSILQWWSHLRYDAGVGPEPWATLPHVRTINCDANFRVELYRCRFGDSDYLIDLQQVGDRMPTIALLRSEELDDFLDLLQNTKLAIASASHCDD